MRESVPASVLARSWGWRHAGRREAAVRELDLNIEPGERVLLLGASGSGKSTLLAALAGVLGGAEEGDEFGQLTVDGSDPVLRRGRSGLLMQDPDSQVVLARVGDDVAFGCENLGIERDEIWRRVRASLTAVGLNLPLAHPTAHLSGGQKQRLALAGVLAMQPGLLLLDEPTANLDPAGVAEVRDAVGAVLETTGATLVVVEHRVQVWRNLVDRVVVLGGDGGMLADGTPAEVLHGQASRLGSAGVWLPSCLPDTESAGVSERQSGSQAVALLRAKDLAIGRPRGGIVADRLQLDVTAGSSVAVTGPNGVGKTTLALTIGGLIPKRSGTLEAAAELAAGASSSPIQWSSRDLLSRIGSVFQSPEHQFVASTVREELAAGPRALGMARKAIERRVDELLLRLRLDAVAAANPFTLSGGQKRRLSVGTALATRPKLLILDEPTFGQDAITWRELVALFGELRERGHSILAVTHDLEFARAAGADEWRMPLRHSASEYEDDAAAGRMR